MNKRSSLVILSHKDKNCSTTSLEICNFNFLAQKSSAVLTTLPQQPEYPQLNFKCFNLTGVNVI